MESWLRPMLCATADVVPQGDEWVIEGKLDGWRAITHLKDDGSVALYGGRNGSSYTGKLPYIEESLRGVAPADTAVDGELIGAGAGGNWNSVQGVMTRGAGPHIPNRHVPALSYVLYDVLRFAGEDLRSKPWHERRAILEALFDGPEFDHLRLSPVAPATQAQHEAFLELGLEGSVCKRTNGRYENRRSAAWVKIKPQTSDEAKIVGFKPGKKGGQWDGKVGAFEVVMLASGARTTVKCGTNARHEEATDHPERWKNVVIEIKHHGLGKDGVPRHPQFLRRRDDRSGAEAPEPTPRRAPKMSTGRMRNYGAMGDAKLLRCIGELRSQKGDAYDRCVNGGSGTPEQDLAVAQEVALERDLIADAARAA